ncbi:oxidoreductase [Actinoplanes philippinensis]|uniref:NADH dehydrogenase, FAD-containing subunit n=1 Tax=Actinoplanes philippinensis TaxID=35752 RepID=A0A1I2LAZ4_9ACTN|nr:FAD-dependent oxidoreductase [Actinoplanes philippinensis]GIE82427.1 oxidoreductase [Actinoplanes philippinensis]SFF74667.1 NADH dehydrogenase, FAD-containing subunit [Actinoplanes philippinensis]
MKHRIVVLGAGYAGLHAAGRLARRLHPADTEITLVNAEPHFVQRIRMHQLATGQHVARRPLRDILAGTGVTLRQARVVAVDAGHNTVTCEDGRQINFDTLVYALGSTAAAEGHHIAGEQGALRVRDRLRALPDGASVLVVGGGLTGIEAVTEIAESRPGLDVRIAVRGEFGDWLGDRARTHLHGAAARLGITVHEHTDGARLPADLTVWATGFTAHPIAGASGVTVTDGRIVVDETMRSVSHPHVYAVGDAALAAGPGGRPLRMSCASGTPMAWQAADAIAARLTGGEPPRNTIRYHAQCISLGRRDGIIQVVTADDRATPKALTGRPAARVKELICAGAAWNLAHPTMLLPARRRHLAVPHNPAEALTTP